MTASSERCGVAARACPASVRPPYRTRNWPTCGRILPRSRQRASSAVRMTSRPRVPVLGDRPRAAGLRAARRRPTPPPAPRQPLARQRAARAHRPRRAQLARLRPDLHRQHEELAHHTLILVLEDVGVIHVRHIGIGEYANCTSSGTVSPGRTMTVFFRPNSASACDAPVRFRIWN
jgi:hypothetical protein